MKQLLAFNFIQRAFICVLTLFVGVSGTADAQYFGRNKIGYRSFDFRVLESPHFELYHYFDNDSVSRHLITQSEKWYRMHQEVLQDTIRFKNPLIFYQNHADFQQTTAISGNIGVGTGGVTEGLKNRVVMPVFESNAQTDHVLGHEMVHAFQYNMLRDSRDSSLSLGNIRNLPLWMVEGMAEYLSIGRIDAHTAMWMRDAYLRNDIPSIKDLNTNPRYFPYRYGQAFWAFVGGVWGDDKIKPLYIETARGGLDAAVDTVFGFNTETLSNMWKSSLQEHYARLMPDTVDAPVGQELLTRKNAGEMNISPSISQDGRYVMFLSEINLFTIDLFLADAKTGKVIRKVSSTSKNGHIDAFSFVESAGAWAPDSRRFAFVAFSKGRNKLIIVDALSGKTVEEHFIPGINAFSNPSWSPDGKGLVLTGLVDGQSDLYYYDFSEKKVVQFTNDWYSDLQPSWSPDGTKIVFATDRISFSEQGPYQKNSFNLAILDTESNTIENIDVFVGANNLNPVFTPDGQEILFLSNRDGYRNMYRYNIASGRVYQLTDLLTGISGITEYSPAMSVARESNDVTYSYYKGNTYTIYHAALGEFLSTEVEPYALDFAAATLPPFEATGSQMVNKAIAEAHKYAVVPADSLQERAYRPKFQLDYIGNTGMGISTSRFGTGIAGGVNAIFSDILGNNQLYSSIAINGEIYDFGGQLAYINQKSRVNWGASISHIPYRSGRLNMVREEIDLNDTTLMVDNLRLDMLRVFEDKVSLFTYLPFSMTRRLEFGGALARYSYRLDRFNNYYYGRYKVGEERERMDAPPAYTLQMLEAAYVGDNSFFGIASPMSGHRFRFGVQAYFGDLKFTTAQADYRRYMYMKPVSVAFRAYHYARYGQDAENSRLAPMYLGMPGLVHGYENVGFADQREMDNSSFSFNDLIGSRMLVTNLELRIPFTGPERLSLIKSRYLSTELNLFLDGGLAWDSGTSFSRKEGDVLLADNVRNARPVFSTGVGLRVNVFGQLVVEPYYAFPFQREDIKGGTFGLILSPGW